MRRRGGTGRAGYVGNQLRMHVAPRLVAVIDRLDLLAQPALQQRSNSVGSRRSLVLGHARRDWGVTIARPSHLGHHQPWPACVARITGGVCWARCANTGFIRSRKDPLTTSGVTDRFKQSLGRAKQPHRSAAETEAQDARHVQGPWLPVGPGATPHFGLSHTVCPAPFAW